MPRAGSTLSEVRRGSPLRQALLRVTGSKADRPAPASRSFARIPKQVTVIARPQPKIEDGLSSRTGQGVHWGVAQDAESEKETDHGAHVGHRRGVRRSSAVGAPFLRHCRSIHQVRLHRRGGTVDPDAAHLQIAFVPLNDKRDALLRDAEGKPATWLVEMGGAAASAREGLSVSGFPRGTVFSVGLVPLRNGQRGGARVEDSTSARRASRLPPGSTATRSKAQRRTATVNSRSRRRPGSPSGMLRMSTPNFQVPTPDSQVWRLGIGSWNLGVALLCQTTDS